VVIKYEDLRIQAFPKARIALGRAKAKKKPKERVIRGDYADEGTNILARIEIEDVSSQ